jgi:hypothetical protein
MNDRAGVVGMPISAYERPLIAWSNQTPSTYVTCLTRPSNVVVDGTSSSLASSSVRPSRES